MRSMPAPAVSAAAWRVFDRADSTEEFQALFSVRGKALYPKLGFLFKMAEEILGTSKVEDTKRLYEIVAAVKSRAQASLTGAGHSTAVLRAISYSSPMAAFQDEMAGIGYYQFIEKLEKDFDQQKDLIVQELRKLMKMILRPENFDDQLYRRERIAGRSEETGCAYQTGT